MNTKTLERCYTCGRQLLLRNMWTRSMCEVCARKAGVSPKRPPIVDALRKYGDCSKFPKKTFLYVARHNSRRQRVDTCLDLYTDRQLLELAANPHLSSFQRCWARNEFKVRTNPEFLAELDIFMRGA